MLSGKPVWTWPSVIAVDAGPMQIQLGAGRKDRFGGEPERYGACLGTQSFCVGESGFMQQIRSNAETGELPGPR